MKTVLSNLQKQLEKVSAELVKTDKKYWSEEMPSTKLVNQRDRLTRTEDALKKAVFELEELINL